jgi:uncharacterized membrane protein
MKPFDSERTKFWDPETPPPTKRFERDGRNGIALWASIIGGSALLGYGLIRRDRAGLATAVAGTALVFRGSRRAQGAGRAVLSPEFDLEHSVTVGRTAEDLYRFWENASNFRRFMYNVKRVDELGHNRQRWVFIGPRNREIEVRTEVISKISNRLISWQTEPGQPYEEWGSVEFTPTLREDETTVTMNISYRLPRGYLSKGIATVAGLDPAQMTRESLRRFKQLMEAREVATIHGQASGRRGVADKGMERLLREQVPAASSRQVG